MKSLWNEHEARKYQEDPLALRVYTSRLLGRDMSLVMHGGGNTSVKAHVNDFFGAKQHVLYIKGSGWDLATIEAQGFAAVKIESLWRMAEIKDLSDTDMVLQQRIAMLNPNAPNPSVEAILHAIIPFTYVDHSHADAIVTITNTPNGQKIIEEIYGKRVLIVPYVMPGFVLARKVYEMTKGLDWSRCEGIVLLNHGLFTFANTAQESYENHIKWVTKAEKHINQVVGKQSFSTRGAKKGNNLLELAQIRRAVGRRQGGAVVAQLKDNDQSLSFSQLSKIKKLATRGTLTPDHVIRTKPKPVVLSKNIENDIQQYANQYQEYFNRYATGKLKILDLAPRWAVWPNQGVITFGRSIVEAQIISDIVDHTMLAIQRSEAMGGWKVLKE